MANKKIFADLTELTSANNADVLPIVDDTTGTPTTKKITVANLIAAAPQGDLLASNNLSDVASASTSRTNLGLGTASTSDSTDFSSAFFSTVTESTTSRTLSDSDNGKIIVCSNSAAITITIALGLTSGFNCKIVQAGAGTVVVEGAGGVAVAAPVLSGSNKTATASQYSTIEIIPVGTNNYYIAGDTTTPPFINTYSVSLDGTDDYVDLGSIAAFTSVNTYSVSFWFKGNESALNTAFGGRQHFYRPDPSGGIGYRINNTGTTLGSSNYLDNQFHQFVLTYSSGSVVGYVDGTQIGTHSNQTTTNSDAGNHMKIGTYSGSTGSPISNYFAGNVDEIGVWSSALSSAEVTEIYASGSVIDLSSDAGNYTSSANLAHWWRCGDTDGGSGTSLTDAAGSANGTLTNGASFASDAP